MYSRSFSLSIVCLGVTMFCSMAPAFGQGRPHEGMVLVAPLVGWNRNELRIQGPPGMPPATLTETAAEYGVFAMYFSPRVVANNMLFFTHVNDADVWGDFAFLNVYGAPEARCTWNAGAGYLWHRISPDIADIEITVPMVKAGLVVRVPGVKLMLNPYLAYAWEKVDTDFGDEETESVLYGLSARWRWRMVRLTLKYYLEDNRDRDEQYNTLRARATVALRRNMGISARLEHMEHSVSDNTSFLIGPGFIF